MQNTTNIFIFYAQKDQDYFQEFEKHLIIYSRKISSLQINHEGKILVGQETETEINNMLNGAHIVILLLSIDLEVCSTYQLYHRTILNLHAQHKIAVMPVLLRHYTWRASDWKNLTPSPKVCDINGKPHVYIDDYSNKDLAFSNVIDDLEGIFEHLQKKQLETPPPQGERKNNQFWILVLSTCKNQLTIAGLPKKQCDKLNNWKENQYGAHAFDWKPFKNENTIGDLLQEYAQKSKFDVQPLKPTIYDDFQTISKYKKRFIVIVDCFALKHCTNKKNKGQIATIFSQIDEIGGLLVPICNQADADMQQYLIAERDDMFKNIFEYYYTSGLQRPYIYVEITVPTKNELFRKLSNIATVHLQLEPIISQLQYEDPNLELYKKQLTTSL